MHGETMKKCDCYLSVADVIQSPMNRAHDNKDGYNSTKQETSWTASYR